MEINGKQVRELSQVVGTPKEFHPEAPKIAAGDLVGTSFIIAEVELVKDWELSDGTLTSFYLLYCYNLKNEPFKTSLGGATKRTIAKLINARAFPVKVLLQSYASGETGNIYYKLE